MIAKKRVTLDEVKQAFGLMPAVSPITGSWGGRHTACPLTALYYTRPGLRRLLVRLGMERLMTWTLSEIYAPEWAVKSFGKDYVEGFTQGVDSRCPLSAFERADDFLLGYHDGRLVRAWMFGIAAPVKPEDEPPEDEPEPEEDPEILPFPEELPPAVAAEELCCV